MHAESVALQRLFLDAKEHWEHSFMPRAERGPGQTLPAIGFHFVPPLEG
jgi:hypothetical protein